MQIDGDGQHNARYLKEMERKMEECDADMVIGSRFIKKEGFQSSVARQMGIRYFTWLIRMLTGVSGVGPRAGLNILSSLGADDLRFAILADDAKRIAKAPGIGAKTAKKIILELKDRLDLEEAFEKKLSSGQADRETAAAGSQVVQDAVEALTALGYGSTEALKAVRAVNPPEDMGVEEVLKEALKRMAF